MCAPSEEQWSRFGWKALSEEAILRKIYEERKSIEINNQILKFSKEICPSLRTQEVENDKNILRILEELKLLSHWESQGFTTITKRQADTHKVCFT